MKRSIINMEVTTGKTIKLSMMNMSHKRKEIILKPKTQVHPQIFLNK